MSGRKKKLIDLDKEITDYTSRIIRKEVGAKSLKDLVDKAKEQGVDVGVRKDTQIKRSLKYFGGILNERIEEENKKIEIKKKKVAKEKRMKDTKYQGEFILKITFEDKTGKTHTKRHRTITATGTKAEIQDLLRDNVIGFEDSESVVKVEVIKSKIRKIKKNENPQSIFYQFLKWRGACNLEGLKPNEEWDTFNNKCVADALYDYYKDKKGLIKNVRKRGTDKPDYDKIEFLGTTINGEKANFLIRHKTKKVKEKIPLRNNSLPKMWFEIDYIEKEVDKEVLDYSCWKPNENGWTIKNLALFCRNINVNLYVLHNKELIFQIQDGNKDCPFIVEVKNNHIYPITDERDRKIIVNNGNLHTSKKKKKEEEEEKVEEELEIIKLFELYDREKYTQEQMLMMECSKRKIMPYKNTINKQDNKLCPVKIDNKLFLFDDNNSHTIKQILGDEYKGEGIGYFCKDSIDTIPKSNFNPQVQEALFVDNVKRRTHSNIYPDWDLEQFNNIVIENPDDYCSADINKHYRYCMENPKDDFCLIDFKAEVENNTQYNKKKFGLWYVKTDDKKLFHGNNWYSNKMIEFAIEEGIVFQVKYFIQGIRIGKDIMKKIIDDLAEKYNIEYTDLFGKKKIFSKLVINSLSGMLGRTKWKHSKLRLDQSADNVWNWVADNKDKNIILDNIGYGNEKMYIYGEENKTDLFENRLPMYLQILDWSNIELYKMVDRLGGFENLVYRKTDCVIMKKNLCFYNYKFNNKIGGYDIEEKFEEKVYYPTRYLNADEPINPSQEWIEHKDINSSDDWKRILNIAEKRGGVLVQGEGGCGKSYIIKQIAKVKKVMMCAFTNKASNNLIDDYTEDNSNISTIHKLLYGATNDKQTIRKCVELAKKYDILIIDEISMVSSYLISLITILKRYTNIPIMLFGDYHQCPPIEEGFGDTQFEFMEHSSIKYLTGNNIVYLDYNEKSRCDKKLRQFALDAYDYKADVSSLPVDKYNPNYPCICYTNKVRKKLNNQAQKYFANKSNRFQTCSYDGDENKYNQDILLFKGAKLLSDITNKEGTLLKNDIYEVEDWNEKDLILKSKRTQKFITTEYKNLHKNFILGYVMTTHKSQGDTIDGKLQITESNKMVLDNRLFYTALTRATKFDNLVLV